MFVLPVCVGTLLCMKIVILCCLNICIASLCGHFAVYSQLCHITDCLILCPARPVDGDEDILF